MPGSTGFFWILIAGAVFGSVHSFLASNTAKKGAERIFGVAMRERYRFYYILIAIVTTSAYLFLVAALPDAAIYRIPTPWLFFTLAVQIASLAGAVAAFREISRRFDLSLPFTGSQNPGSSPSQKPELATTGLYRWVRHPIYDCVFIFIWLFPIMSWNLLAFAIAATAYMIIGAHLEERKLIEQFGASYEDYRSRTSMFLPIRLK